MYEIKKYEVNILKPDINISTCSYEVLNNNIVCPFNIIKGISKIICTKIINNRDNKYLDIYDFFSKNNDLTKNNLELLIEAGCLDSFNYNRHTLINNLDSLLNYASLCKDLDTNYVLKPEIMLVDEYDISYLTNKEKELYGFYISNHPVISYKSKYQDIINLVDISNYFNKKVNLLVLVERIRVIATKKGDKMMFFAGSDEETMADFTMFPNEYKKYANLEKGDIIKVYGKIEKRNGSYQIIIENLEKLN